MSDRARVLIVDDTTENLDILFAALNDRYSLIAAKNGEKALQLARRTPSPDLILLDIMMPGIDGYEVCRQLKQAPDTEQIPVIFLTALTNEQSELKGFELGAVDYIYKPFSIPVVQSRVATHIALLQARRQLAKQVTALTEAAKLRDDVDQIMRHDLKGPLNPILGYCELLQADPDISEDQRDSIDEIHLAGLTMLEMINRSLDLYKMESGDYCSESVPVDLDATLQRVSKTLSTLAKQRQINIVVNGHARALGEEMLCYSMFCNLVKNAIEAAPEKSTITVALAIQGEHTAVSIHNLGSVPKTLRDSFFDKYTTSGKQGGTGIGTYSAKLMAETMHGEISMRSDEVSGTEVVVLLPCAEEPPPSAMP